ncbi:MAG: hypothetical protein K1X74_13435 [Pirellulales bacterium]|nr:hypothetical protein [Pirellulales bacterium]
MRVLHWLRPLVGNGPLNAWAHNDDGRRSSSWFGRTKTEDDGFSGPIGETLMKKTISCVALAALAGLCASSAHAAPVSVSLTLQPSSILSLTVNALGGITASTTTVLSGNQNVTIDNGDMRVAVGNITVPDLADTISLDGGLINISDASLNLNLGPLGTVLAGFQNAKLTGLTSTGNLPLNYIGGFATYNFDPGDPFGGNVTSTSINNGVLTYSGSGAVALLLGSGTLDFATDPVGFDLPELGDVATLNQSETFLGASTMGSMICSTYNVDVLLSAPLSVSQNILTDPIDVLAILQGQIVASGSYLYTVCVPIPEPSSIVLLGIASIGMLPLVRRLRKK